MATRPQLLDALRELITREARNHETDFALGRDVSFPLSGPLAEASPNGPELTLLLAAIAPNLERDDDLIAEIGLSGSRDDGKTVIHLRKTA